MIAHVCSLAAGNDSHPTGSSIVKEVYDRSGRLQGWTAMVKTQADSAGWFSVEIASTTDDSKPVVGGNGIPLCFGCHSTRRILCCPTARSDDRPMETRGPWHPRGQDATAPRGIVISG